MKFKEISNKTKTDLIKMVAEKKEELRQFRFGGAGAKTKNTKHGNVIKKDIARIMTAMNKLDKKE
jgi:ribosomal protein L29